MLPAEIVSQVRRIQLTTGRQVADVLAGAYVSVFKGRGVEFDEVRPYVPGDDVRTIDWNVTARVGAPYVKRYVEERQLTVMLLVDMSASLDFGSAHRSKREAAVELSALLAFSAIYNDDKVGLLLFHAGVDEYIPPRKGQKHALRVVREVLARGREETDDARSRRRAQSWARLPQRLAARFAQLRQRTGRGTRRATDIALALEFCRRVLPRRAILFLVSDFIDEDYLDVLSNTNRKHDVVAVRVVDPRESAIEGGGLVTLEDAESGDRRLVDTGSNAFREAFRVDAQERVDSLERALSRVGIDLITVDAAHSVVDPLLRFFRMREKRNRR
ncbi:MAG: DUF58 domain-containing protein [Gammaproteobacteria bacterium]|nr:DUF58 domain-containing protein [Gammaproteobacteria bacterium]